MSRLNLRRFDVQARVSAALSLLAAAPMLAAGWAAWRRYDPELRAIRYGSGSWLMPALLGCAALGVIAGGLGMFLGASSAGQRRNDRQGLSWIGFFVGAIAVTGSMVVAVAFYLLKIAVA